jgi:hypothetical protein
MDKNYIREMGDAVAAKLPDNHGFIVHAAPFGGDTGGRTVYTSNVVRADAIKLLKEFLFRIGESEDWMKHIK